MGDQPKGRIWADVYKQLKDGNVTDEELFGGGTTTAQDQAWSNTTTSEPDTIDRKNR